MRGKKVLLKHFFNIPIHSTDKRLQFIFKKQNILIQPKIIFIEKKENDRIFPGNKSVNPSGRKILIHET